MKHTPALLLLLLAGDVLAATTCPNAGPSICTIARNINSELGELSALLQVGAATIGFIFGIVAAFKLKSHRDNPQQTTITVPLVWFVCGILLISVPAVFGSAISTVFGDGVTAAGLVRPPPEKASGPAPRL